MFSLIFVLIFKATGLKCNILHNIFNLNKLFILILLHDFLVVKTIFNASDKIQPEL